MSRLQSYTRQFLQFIWKFTRGSEGNQTVRKKFSPEEDRRRIILTVAPWQFKPYEEQLEQKKIYCRNVALKLANRLTEKNKRFPPSNQMLDHVQHHNGLLFAVPDITPSPRITGYRNTDKCAIGIGPEEKAKVGWFVYPGKFPKMDVASCPNMIMKPQHYDIMQAFEDVVRQSGRLTPGTLWTQRHEEHSNWRKFLVRSNEAGDMMIGVTMIPPKNIRNEEMLHLSDKARDDTFKFFLYGPGKKFNVKSLWFHYSHHYHPRYYQILCGQPTIEETLCGYKFNISPESFFQVNTKAAEVIYEKIRDMCALNKNTVLLDVCCGIGTIGIVLSKYVRTVIGIESNYQAVADAIANAEMNGVANAAYIKGKAEEKLPRVLARTARTDANTEFVVVLNPPRKGSGVNLIRALRNCEQIKKVLYISCKPHGGAKNNIYNLCEPAGLDKKITGPPFLPTRSAAVDMFPHTKHFELLLLFER